jgi:hypothetical protein
MTYQPEEIKCFKHGNCSCSLDNCEQTCHICGKEYRDSPELEAWEELKAHRVLRHKEPYEEKED